MSLSSERDHHNTSITPENRDHAAFAYRPSRQIKEYSLLKNTIKTGVLSLVSGTLLVAVSCGVMEFLSSNNQLNEFSNPYPQIVEGGVIKADGFHPKFPESAGFDLEQISRLQSEYEDFDTGQVDANGKPIIITITKLPVGVK